MMAFTRQSAFPLPLSPLLYFIFFLGKKPYLAQVITSGKARDTHKPQAFALVKSADLAIRAVGVSDAVACGCCF